MANNIVFNGSTYQIPVHGDVRWGAYTTRYLTALGTYTLTPSGGSFPLTTDVDFGTSFGLKAKYLISTASDRASAGFLRLANTEAIEWRNFDDDGDNSLAVDGSDNLTWNGSVLNTLSLPVPVSDGGTGISSTTEYAVLVGGTTSTGPLQTPGVGSSGQVLTSQGPGTLPIWSAAGTGSGTVNVGTANQLAYYASSTNAVSDLTAITASKALVSDANGLPVASTATTTELQGLHSLTASRAIVTDGSGILTAATTTATEIGYVNGVTSAIQTQIDTKAPTASPTFTGTVTVPNGSAATNAAAFGQVKVLQTVFNSTTTQTNTTSSTFTACTNATVTITPTSASNRVLLLIAGNFLGAASSGTVTLKRGSTELSGQTGGFVRNDTAAYAPMSIIWIDSPATTGATTYQVFIRSADNTSTVQFGSNTTITSLIAMEIV